MLNWESESYPLVKDLQLVPVLALLFPLIRLVLDRSVFEALGKRLVHADDQEKTHRKFKESAWKFTYFSLSSLLALVITFQEPWFTDTRQFWIGPGDEQWPDQKIKLKLKTLYIVSGGFYVYSILALVFWETRRRDFVVSMTHHVVTFFLIAGSYSTRFGRIGSMVLVLHDFSDIFLESGKMSTYAGSDSLSIFFLSLFVISWVLLRLVYFPLIIRSTSYEVLTTLDQEAARKFGGWYYYVFNTFLITLLVLHAYWTKCIFLLVKKQWNGKEKIEDVRSDSEDEDE